MYKPQEKMIVIKASGEKVPFSMEKLRHSLIIAGADDVIVEEVVEKMKPYLHDEISTKKIHKYTFDILRNVSRRHAGRYNLKKAMMELGPGGFPFEKYISEILKFQGFKTRVGVIIQGYCVTHEVDVVAEDNNNHFMIECKFHNMPGIKSNVKIPLYVHARFQDIEKQRINTQGEDLRFNQGWVVTNTRFTDDAIEYGTCVGLYLLGWEYPKGRSLNELIDRSNLYPLTCLSTLTKQEKKRLLDQGLVLCNELKHSSHLLDHLHISNYRKKEIMREVHDLS